MPFRWFRLRGLVLKSVKTGSDQHNIFSSEGVVSLTTIASFQCNVHPHFIPV